MFQSWSFPEKTLKNVHDLTSIWGGVLTLPPIKSINQSSDFSRADAERWEGPDQATGADQTELSGLHIFCFYKKDINMCKLLALQLFDWNCKSYFKQAFSPTFFMFTGVNVGIFGKIGNRLYLCYQDILLNYTDVNIDTGIFAVDQMIVGSLRIITNLFNSFCFKDKIISLCLMCRFIVIITLLYL